MQGPLVGRGSGYHRDQGRHRSPGHGITYSSADHLPPVVLHPDRAVDLLDQATDPPLGTRPTRAAQPQAVLPYTRGDALVLYTDGLIERRGEDIDTGLDRLTDALTHHARLAPERLADALLARLGLSSGARDDIALIVVRLQLRQAPHP